MNHTSNEHEWASRARSGVQDFQNYFYIFDNRDIPDMFEETMPEIFPETAPGNFAYDETMGKWVMTVFNDYQWDLNYGNPAVFIEMLDIILFWANQGADIVRLDAVASRSSLRRLDSRIARFEMGLLKFDPESNLQSATNGKRVESHVLSDGDVLKVGDFVLSAVLPAGPDDAS